MMKIFLLLAIQSGIINFTQNKTRTVELKYAGTDGVTIRFSFPDISYDYFQIEGKKFIRFDTKDIGVLYEVGKPELPAIRRLIEVPEGAKVEYEIISMEKGKLALKDLGVTEKIIPAYPPVPKIEGAKPKLVMDKAVYSTSLFWPESIFNIKKAGVIRGHNLYLVEFFPLRYNPVTNEIEYITSLEVRIKFEGGNLARTSGEIKRLYSPYFQLSLKDKILNYGTLEDTKLNPDVPVVYLIITPPSWVDELEPLIQWKKKKGYTVKIATIGDSLPSGDSTTVRNYILNAYYNWSTPPTFVLLVGDVDSILNFPSSETDNPANDLPYETMDSTDYLPDLYVGRFSVSTSDELIALVAKTVNYETVAWSQGKTWAQRAYFMATNDATYHPIAESTHLYCMELVRNHGMTADSLFAYYGTGTPVAEAFNTGRSLATYSGHGDITYWAGPSFTASDVYNLVNTDMYPLVQSYACLTGAYTNAECFMETWIRASGKGAVTAFGSSVYSYWDEDDILERRVFDELFDTGYVWVKGAINEGKIDLYIHYGGAGNTHRYFQQYNLFGDPSLYLITNIPEGVIVNHPNIVPIGPGLIQITVTDSLTNPLEGILVAARQGDILFDAGYTDNTGTVTLNVFPITPDTIWVTATGYNITPHFSYVIPQSSGPYVCYLSSQIDDTSGNANGRINPGESINLRVLLKNWGNDTAHTVYALLSTTDSNINITEDSVFYGDISDGDSTAGYGIYSFNVSLNARDKEILPFQLEIHSVETTWTSMFNLAVYAPSLAFNSVEILDTFPGCNNNGYPDPGERVSIVVSLKNVGSEDAPSVYALLSTGQTGVTLNQDSSYYGNIGVDSVVKGTSYDLSFDATVPVGTGFDFYLDIHAGQLSFVDSFRIYAGVEYYSTNLETPDTAWWSPDNPWHLTERAYHSASHSFWCGDEGTGIYSNNLNVSLYMPPFIALNNETLRFYTKYDIENGWDYGYVEVSTDGAHWSQLKSYTGSTGGSWVYEEIPVNGVSAGDTVFIRFRMYSDYSVTYEGWYIDDITFGPLIFLPNVELDSYEIVYDDNSNGVTDFKENVKIMVRLLNTGPNQISSVTGILRSLDGNAQVLDSISYYGDIPGSGVVEGDTFELKVVSTDDRKMAFRLYVTGEDFEDSVDFTIPIGRYVGPCKYGYYAYSDRSPYPFAPSFEWIEIKNTGIPVADGDDTSEVVRLPFAFKYFGITYTEVTICSNGWIALGGVDNNSYANSEIPLTDDPNNIIAGVWDDLSPTENGKIYYYYDNTAHTFIVEWDSVSHYGDTCAEKFEIILYDPLYYPTPTGDGEIVVQYLVTPGQTDYTAGIENSDGTDGIQYYYGGTHDEFADEIRAGTAIKYTTYSVGDTNLPALPREFEFSTPYPNPSRGIFTIKFAIPEKVTVKLEVFDILGRKVQTILSKTYEPGYYITRFDGRGLPQGIYFMRFTAGSYRETRKIIIVK